MTAESAEFRLFHLSGPGETKRQNYICDWLRELGIKNVEPDYSTPEGPADIYLSNRRIIIEVKKAGRLKGGPRKSGTGSPNEGRPNESAYEQVGRYVLAERERERRYPDDTITDLLWIGIVTDATNWWIWEWPAAGPGVSDNQAWQGTRLAEHNVKQLAKIFKRSVGKEWAPADPTDLFRGSLESLRKLYERQRDLPATRTQRGLWLEQLKAGGNAPSDGDQDELFVVHKTLCVFPSKD